MAQTETATHVAILAPVREVHLKSAPKEARSCIRDEGLEAYRRRS